MDQEEARYPGQRDRRHGRRTGRGRRHSQRGGIADDRQEPHLLQSGHRWQRRTRAAPAVLVEEHSVDRREWAERNRWKRKSGRRRRTGNGANSQCSGAKLQISHDDFAELRDWRQRWSSGRWWPGQRRQWRQRCGGAAGAGGTGRAGARAAPAAAADRGAAGLYNLGTVVFSSSVSSITSNEAIGGSGGNGGSGGSGIGSRGGNGSGTHNGGAGGSGFGGKGGYSGFGGDAQAGGIVNGDNATLTNTTGLTISFNSATGGLGGNGGSGGVALAFQGGNGGSGGVNGAPEEMPAAVTATTAVSAAKPLAAECIMSSLALSNSTRQRDRRTYLSARSYPMLWSVAREVWEGTATMHKAATGEEGSLPQEAREGRQRAVPVDRAGEPTMPRVAAC